MSDLLIERGRLTMLCLDPTGRARGQCCVIVPAGMFSLVADLGMILFVSGASNLIVVVNIKFILPRTTGYIPVVWVRLVAFTKLRHHQKWTQQVNLIDVPVGG